ncbi:Fzd6 [Phodopus roborovskii]|uniref:Fzd6 protein n=1 Tax=Phodopus roborovskii TaxID=109678 RepID=A0AAV0A285_PHORO|nr:Fzd6 [Phodopus roborovskii]
MEMSPFLWLCLFLPSVRGHSLFTCEPITVPRCMKMTYNMTFFPNLMHHYDQGIAAVEMEFLSFGLVFPKQINYRDVLV